MRDLNTYSESYKNSDFEDVIAFYRKEIIVDTLNKYCSEQSSILEIGCGLDSIVNHYQKFKSFTVLEPATLFYNKCEADVKGHTKADNIKIVKATAQELETDEKFDVIIIAGLLHEVQEPSEILNSIKKFCTKDTIIHISVPNAISFHRLLALEMNLIENLYEKSDTQIKLQQHHTFDKQTLADLINSCDFKIQEYNTYFIKPFTHKQMKSLLDSTLFDEKILNGLMKLTKYFPDNGCELYMNLTVNE